jgi:hypothetical protein
MNYHALGKRGECEMIFSTEGKEGNEGFSGWILKRTEVRAPFLGE